MKNFNNTVQKGGVPKYKEDPPPPMAPPPIKRTPKNDMEADLMFEFYHRRLGKLKGD